MSAAIAEAAKGLDIAPLALEIAEVVAAAILATPTPQSTLGGLVDAACSAASYRPTEVERGQILTLVSVALCEEPERGRA